MEAARSVCLQLNFLKTWLIDDMDKGLRVQSLLYAYTAI